MVEMEKSTLCIVQEELNKVCLENVTTPGGKRLLNNNLDDIASEIIKLLMLRKFTTVELGIIFSLVIYRVTGKWQPIVLEDI